MRKKVNIPFKPKLLLGDVLFIFKFLLRFPKLFFTFLYDFIRFLVIRGVYIYRKYKEYNHKFANFYQRQKNVAVRQLFWGRGDMYKYLFRGTFVITLMGWMYISFGGGVSYATTRTSDAASILQAQAFDVELGSSYSPIDEDRPRDDVIEYTVQGNDTLSGIASKFDITIQTIKWANGLSNDFIKPNQTLTILPVTGVLHEVKSGDTLASVAEKYDASEQAIADVNWLDPPFDLRDGQELMVPGGEIAPPPAPVVVSAPVVTTPAAAPSTPPDAGVGLFAWPTSGNITQYFWRWHGGVDIANKSAPNVIAAASGKVIYSGWDSSGYGLTILIDHGNGYVTRYAHSSSLYVSTGEWVERGQSIMRMGSTGRSTGTHLHFEIKYNGVNQNPMAYY